MMRYGWILALLAACSDPSFRKPEPDGGTHPTDAAVTDAGGKDAGERDAATSPEEAGEPDVELTDPPATGEKVRCIVGVSKLGACTL